MRRRDFLRASSAATVALASWPVWLRSAFAKPATPGPGSGSVPERVAVLAAAYRRAAALGKPLLVIVIPAADESKFARGEVFGEYLNHATDAQLAPLALAEVACATMADLGLLVPVAELGEPLLMLVETDRVPAPVAALDAQLPSYRREYDGEQFDYLRREQLEDAVGDARIAKVAALIRSGLATSPELLRARASLSMERTGELTNFADLPSATSTAAQLVAADRAAAPLFAFASTSTAPDFHRVESGLAAAVRARLTVHAPSGSRWAHSSGCGVAVDGDLTGGMAACGMGYVPRKSRRFLYLFARTPSEQWRDELKRTSDGDSDGKAKR